MEAELELKVIITCDDCEEEMDLINDDEFQYLRDDGHIYKLLFDDVSTWGKIDGFNERINCTCCGKSLMINKVIY